MNLQLSLMDLGTLVVSLLMAAGAQLALRRRNELTGGEASFMRWGVIALTIGLVLDLIVNDLVGRWVVIRGTGPLTATDHAAAGATLPTMTFVSYLAVKFFVVAVLARLSLASWRAGQD